MVRCVSRLQPCRPSAIAFEVVSCGLAADPATARLFFALPAPIPPCQQPIAQQKHRTAHAQPVRQRGRAAQQLRHTGHADANNGKAIVDATTVRAHQHGAAAKGGLNNRPWAQPGARWTTRVHSMVGALLNPAGFHPCQGKSGRCLPGRPCGAAGLRVKICPNAANQAMAPSGASGRCRSALLSLWLQPRGWCCACSSLRRSRATWV